MAAHQHARPIWILIAILVLYLVIGIIYAQLTPPWQVPDEPAHYNYVRYLVQEQRFPVLRPGDYDQAYLQTITTAKFHPDYPIDSLRYEFHQPPLYYLLAAPVYALSGGALLPLRLLGVVIGAGVIVVAWATGQVVFPTRPWMALSVAAFVAFNPQHIAMTAAVQNDGLAELLIGLVLLGLLRRLNADDVSNPRAWIGIGLLSGLGLLTKTSAYITLPLIVLAVFLRRRAIGSWKALGKTLLAVLLPALLLGLLWWGRNVVTYGGLDILGLARHEQVVVGQPRTVEFIARNGWRLTLISWLTTVFHSFWGQFGWMAVPIDSRIYTVLEILCVVVTLGFFFWLIDRLSARRPLSPAAILLTCAALLTVGALLWYNLSFYQAQGRYLFPALIPFGVAWTLGLSEALRRRNAMWVGAMLAAVTALGVVRWVATGHADKWRLLFTGSGAVAWGVRWLWRDERIEPWLLGAFYPPLIALCAACPFLFIVPYLTP